MPLDKSKGKVDYNSSSHNSHNLAVNLLLIEFVNICPTVF